jgi:hypothetical protein
LAVALHAKSIDTGSPSGRLAAGDLNHQEIVLIPIRIKESLWALFKKKFVVVKVMLFLTVVLIRFLFV